MNRTFRVSSKDKQTQLLICVLVARPDDVSHCRILSPDKTEWRLISATLCGWRCCFVADQLWFMTRIREEEKVDKHHSARGGWVWTAPDNQMAWIITQHAVCLVLFSWRENRWRKCWRAAAVCVGRLWSLDGDALISPVDWHVSWHPEFNYILVKRWSSNFNEFSQTDHQLQKNHRIWLLW